MTDIIASLQRIAIFAIPLLLGMTLHELAHGYAAYLQGDSTAKNAGRLTLNPIKHLDPMGSFVFVLTAIASPFVIGWAKPVPINPRFFRNVRKGLIQVSLAGPGTNIVLALAFALLLKVSASFADGPVPDWIYPVFMMMAAGVVVNLALAIFNMLPIPPLDGSKVVTGILPPHLAMRYLQIERYGFIILILLLATGILGRIIGPALFWMINLIINVFNLPGGPFLALLQIGH